MHNSFGVEINLLLFIISKEKDNKHSPPPIHAFFPFYLKDLIIYKNQLLPPIDYRLQFFTVLLFLRAILFFGREKFLVLYEKTFLFV